MLKNLTEKRDMLRRKRKAARTLIKSRTINARKTLRDSSSDDEDL